MAVLLPLIAGAGLLGAGWLGGRAGGGAIELLTTKKSQQITQTFQETYAPTITRTYDVQYNIATGGSAVTTKKEQAITQQPAISPSVVVVPTTAQGGGVGAGNGGFDIMSIVIIGGLGLGAWYFLKKKK